MSCEGGEVKFDIVLDASQAIAAWNEATRALREYLALANRTGLPENAELAIRRALQLQAALMSLYRSILLLEAASGPLGMVMALISLTAGAFVLKDLGNTLYDDMRGA